MLSRTYYCLVAILLFFSSAVFSVPLISTHDSAVINGRPATGVQQREYIRGPRGGCYYINKNGNKTYVDHSYCDGKSAAAAPKKNSSGTPSSSSGPGRTYSKGPRGGCYYINDKGKKVYVARELCE